MFREIDSRQYLSKIVNTDTELVDMLRRADAICHHCKPASPMTCLEQCEIWRAKNEFVELNAILNADNHEPSLLNALKNDKRRRIVEALSVRSCNAKGIQKYLKTQGSYHSQHTIDSAYVKPLVRIGFVRKDGGKYRLTLYGQKFLEVLNKHNVENPLPSHSRCYEEILLRKLCNGTISYSELAESTNQRSLSRSLSRLRERGLITRSKNPAYVFYFRTKKVPKKTFSPTEKKVYDAIPKTGISSRDLSRKAGINLRRTYKYLRRLRKRRLVFTRKKPRIYELTPSGKELAAFLGEVVNLISDAARASAFLLEHSEQTADVADRFN